MDRNSSSALERPRVDVVDVKRSMDDNDRPGLRDAVEILACELSPADVQGIEAPRVKRRVRILHLSCGILQTSDNRIDVGHARHQTPFRRPARKRADIGHLPHQAFHDVAVPFDEAGH